MLEYEGDKRYMKNDRLTVCTKYILDMMFYGGCLVTVSVPLLFKFYGKYNTTPYDKLKLDLFYIENYSVWLDLKLMLLTLKILFQPDSTEGVEENQVTAIKKMAEDIKHGEAEK